MYYKLALNNLKSQKSRSILTLIGIAIGAASLLGIIAFSNGIKNAVIDTISSRGPLTQITVEPLSREGGFLKSLATINSNEDKITPETVSKIKQIPHVANVYPQLNYDNISSLRVNIWNQSFQTDTMLFGLPYQYIKEDLETDPAHQKNWQNATEPYPALISTNIINLYNLTVAPSNNLPSFSEQDIIGLEFTLLPGQSTFFPTISEDIPSVKARIVGFSDKVDLIGVTLPPEAIRNFNSQIGRSSENYLKTFVDVDDPKNVEKVTSKIESMDLNTKSTKLEIRIFENNFRIVTVGLGLISAIILFISGLMIANTYYSSVNERKKEIGLFRALGATRGDIQKIFLAEASLLGLTGGIIGVLFAWLGGFIVDSIALSAFPDVTTKPETLLYYDYWTIFGIIIFTIILSVTFAFLPSTVAARMEPLKAISS